jgi:SAM-dependent methyltransferase
MDHWMDRAIAKVAERLSRTRMPSPSVALLGECRMHAADLVRARHEAAGRELAARMDRGDREASEQYGALAERALADMRNEVKRRARTFGAPETLAALLHERWADTDEPEHIDDPTMDREARVRVLNHLDAFNTALGSYRAFFRAMEPLLERDRPTRILDLAAGHGGFALEAMRIAAASGLEIEMTASDLMDEYLEIGRAIASREGLDVKFAVQDALDLRAIEVGRYDLIVCTQSLHHFPASMLARMFREAARVAGRGVVFIDGCRSVLQGLLVPALGMVRYRDRVFAHDAWISFRRFYSPEELGLIARLGPEAPGVEARWMRPGHCLVRWRRA